MNDQRTIDTLRRTIADLDRFIAKTKPESAQHAKAVATRSELKDIIDRLIANDRR